MKKIILSMISLVFLFGVFGSLVSCVTDQGGPRVVKKEIRDTSFKARKSDDSSPRKRLMILPFLDSNAEHSESLRNSARAEFIRLLNKTNEVVVIDSKDLSIDPKKYVQNNEYQMIEMAKAAQNLGVAAVLEGKIMDIRIKRISDSVGIMRQMKSHFEVILRVRMYTARNSRELLSQIKTVTLEEANVRVAENVDSDRYLRSNPDLIQKLIEDSFIEFIPPILSSLDKISWEGRVAGVSGDRIFLNVGRISGLQVGDILRVTEDGDDVYDPQTGNFIGKTPGRLKGTLEVVSYFGQDGSVAVVHSGSGFKENDKIELY